MSKRWKNVSIAECFGIIFTSIICLAIAFIPFILDPMTFSFNALPIIGDGTLTDAMYEFSDVGLPTLIPAMEDYIDYVDYAYYYLIIGYFGILVLNIINSLVLILTSSKFWRKLSRAISILSGIILLFTIIASLLYLVALFSSFEVFVFMDFIDGTGALFMLGLLIFSIFLSSRQFGWFKNPFDI